MMKTTRHAPAAAMLAALLATVGTGLGQEVPLAPGELVEFADGLDGAGLPQFDPRAPATLVAPELEPTRIELPPTVVPRHRLEEMRVLAADLDGDGAVTGADLAQLVGLLGECAGGAPCRGDVNADGRVDQLDAAAIAELIGRARPAGALIADKKEVGYVNAAPAQAAAPIAMQERRDGSLVARLELSSRDARGLRVQVRGLAGSDMQVRVYDPAGTAVHGPYEAWRVDDEGLWWSPSIFGDVIGLEFYLPAGGKPSADELSIVQVAYVYTCDCHGGPGSALSCHNDVMCFGFGNEARAVGALGFVSGGSCFLCTGALLNRQAGDFVPLLMTANHCISTQAEAGSLEVLWLWQRDGCGGDLPDFDDLPRTDGAVLLKRRSDNDWTLLGLLERPTASPYFLGWTTATNWSTSAADGIHHPAGSWKRISFGTENGSNLFPGVFCDAGGENCFTIPSFGLWDVDYFDGTTQGGSSGSPLLDGQRRVRGTLTGGPSGCPNPEIRKSYGRLDGAYQNIRYYLATADIPSIVHVNRNFSGDAGNNGNTERGTSANPFNTFREGVYQVISGDEVRVQAGNYNERVTIWRPMTITRWGSSGIVRIGAP